MAVGKNEKLHFVSSTTFKCLVLFDIEFWLMAHISVTCLKCDISK